MLALLLKRVKLHASCFVASPNPLALQAEVQSLSHSDGAVALQTRSAKYGKVTFLSDRVLPTWCISRL